MASKYQQNVPKQLMDLKVPLFQAKESKKTMKLFKPITVLYCTALVSVALAPTAKADDYDKKTTFTFSGPVEIPPVYVSGMRVLPAGTYVFKLMNSSSNRHIVQIFNADQTKIYATILAIPNYRLKPTDKTVITFNEGVRGKPESIRAWFYPGANWGEEFVYPKAKAVELAKATNLPVLALEAEVRPEAAKPDEPQILTQLAQVPVVAVRPTGEVVELAQVVQPPPPPAAPAVIAQAAPVTTQIAQAPAPIASNRLPDTASPLPLAALLGMFALGGAFAIRRITKRL